MIKKFIFFALLMVVAALLAYLVIPKWQHFGAGIKINTVTGKLIKVMPADVKNYYK